MVNFRFLDMMRRVARANGYKDLTPDSIRPFYFSKTQETKDKIKDLLLDPETSVWEFSEGSSEFNKYMNIQAIMAQKYG